jgi:hypothetical protein
MGLDQYAEFRNSETQKVEQFYGWRKHNAMHEWMENLWRSKGNIEEFNRIPLELSRADIDALERDLLEGNLPEPEVFFFDFDTSNDDHRLAGDLSFIRQARQHLDAGNQVTYDSWW